MTDKILTEAFDKLKAIEESDDPFCIGAKADEVVETYTEVEEPIAEQEDQFSEDKTYSISTDSGDDYQMHFQSNPRGGDDECFVEANGIDIGHFTVGGGGSMGAKISKPDELMNMLFAAMQAADGSGR